MRLEDQVCTLEQGKTLKRLGINNIGLFEWYYHDRHKEWQPLVQGQLLPKSSKGRFPCLTTAELGEVLPSESGLICWDVSYNDHHGVWNCRIYDLVKWFEADQKTPMPPIAYESESDTMAEAMTDALIHCLENKLTTAEQVNNSLK